MFASIIINAGAAKRLKEGYPWVFSRDVLSRRFQTAGIVGVMDKRGEFLGQAFYSPKSKIALRLISRSKVNISKNFWIERIRRSFERRCPGKASDAYRGESNYTPPEKRPTLNGGTLQLSDAYRVVYAESDGLPSIIIDKYNDIVSFQITSAGAETIKEDIIAAIEEVLRPVAIIEKDDIEVRKLEGLPLIERAVLGNKTTTIVTEGDQRFKVDVLHGQKTGAYLDYQGFRLKARDLSLRGSVATEAIPRKQLSSGDCFAGARNDTLTALDLFCYQGWMACHLAKNFAKVVAVDASQDAIDAAKRNAELNGHKNIEFICADVFEYLKGDSPLFDFIHLDPPPFAKGRADLPTAIKGYKKLNGAAMKFLKPGGILFTSSCSHHISENMLEKIVRDSVADAGAKCDVIYRGIQDKDHPVMKGFPESLYLKALAIQVLPR